MISPASIIIPHVQQFGSNRNNIAAMLLTIVQLSE